MNGKEGAVAASFCEAETAAAMPWADSSGERRAAGGAGVAAAGSGRRIRVSVRKVWGRRAEERILGDTWVRVPDGATSEKGDIFTPSPRIN